MVYLVFYTTKHIFMGLCIQFQIIEQDSKDAFFNVRVLKIFAAVVTYQRFCRFA